MYQTNYKYELVIINYFEIKIEISFSIQKAKKLLIKINYYRVGCNLGLGILFSKPWISFFSS